MATFFGDTVEAGDVLHDVQDGPITVVSVHSNHMRCRRGSGRTVLYTYGYDGLLRGRRSRRTLYWRDPIVMEPRKDEKLYLRQVQAVRTVAALMADVVEASEVIEDLPVHESQEPSDLQKFLAEQTA